MMCLHLNNEDSAIGVIYKTGLGPYPYFSGHRWRICC